MSQAEELLNSLDASNTSGESHIVIGKDRFITVPDSLKRLAVQYDHDIETVTFDCPRYWDEHDMSTMTIYVNYLCADNEPGCYKVKNVAVDSTDSTIMHFDWVISKNVTMAHGPIAFLVCVKNTDADGVEKNHWNSEICKDCFISAGMEYDGVDINEIYPDIIEQWRQEVLAITDDIVAARENGEFQGEPGVSPTIQVSDIEGGHRVTITDVEGTKTFDVMDTIVDGTDAVNELLNSFVSIGTEGARPHNNLLFYTDVSDIAEGAFDESIGAYLSYNDGTGYSYAFYPRTRKDLVFGMDEIDNFVTANKGIVAHSDDGITYTATVPGITELTEGASFLMIPDVDSETEFPKLNVNNLGNLYITRKTNSATGITWDNDPNIPDEEARPYYWLTGTIPIRVTYDGISWVADFTIVYGDEIFGSVPIANGGTGATSIEQAAKNLKFNSLAYATRIDTNFNIDELINVGKYMLPRTIYNNSSDTTQLPFQCSDWSWCIITVEDALGSGNVSGDTESFPSYFQTVENDIREKFSRCINFESGGIVIGDWVQHNTSKSPIVTSQKSYGVDLPSNGVDGQVFFKKNDGCYIFEGGTSGWVKYF